MTALRMVSMALVVGLLGGCATTRPLPPLPDSEYSQRAEQWAALHECPARDYMTVENAVLGKNYLSSLLKSNYQVDIGRFDAEVRRVRDSGNPPSKAYCTQLSMSIYEKKRQIEIGNQQVEDQQRQLNSMINSTRPVNTYCNKIGTQTFCNSY